MCMTILAGRNASETGDVLVGHNEDAPGRFTMQTHIVHKKRRGPGKFYRFEPELALVEMPETRARLFWSEAKTYSADSSASAFCDFYANGHGVIICSNNCAYSREDNPQLLDGGIGYGLRRVVAERAYTAKEALDIACDLVERYGYASSGRSYAFADSNEIFVMQIVHGKHYAVQRVPDDEVAVIPNHYTIHEGYSKARGYEELVSYAIKRGWYKPDEGPFDFKRAYQVEESFGIEKNTHRHVRAFEILLDMDLSGLLTKTWEPLPFSIKPARKVSIDTLKKILRTHFEDTPSYNAKGTPHFMKPLTVCNAETLESTIAQIRHTPDRIIFRRALGRPCYSPYLPFYFGITGVPEGYEDKDPDTSLAEHFQTKPEDMDFKNNAWFKAQEIHAASDILYDSKSEIVRSKVKAVEERIERELGVLDPQIELRLMNEPDIARAMMEGALMSWSALIDDANNTIRKELGIITGEAMNSVTSRDNFRVRIHEDIELSPEVCICGPSYLDVTQWSECAGISRSNGNTELEFKPARWIEEAVPCFADLYMKLGGRAGTVRIQIRR